MFFRLLLLLLCSGLLISWTTGLGNLRLDVASAIVVLDACWCLLDFLAPEGIEVTLDVSVLFSESILVALQLHFLVKLLFLLLLELSKFSQSLALLQLLEKIALSIVFMFFELF